MNDIEHSAFPLPVPAALGGATIQTVNARALHEALGNRDRYTTWFADRVRQYGFTENVDYVGFSETSEKGGRPKIQHAISLDMAKELCMVERTEAGKLARRYYIECERKAQVPADPIAALSDPATMRGLLLTYSEKVIALEDRVKEMEPEVAAYERLAASDGSFCITDAAKTLGHRPKDLFAFLRAHGWIYTRAGSNEYIAYGPRLAQGLLEHKTTTVTRSDGSEKTVTQVRVTPKGLARLAKEFPPIVMAA